MMSGAWQCLVCGTVVKDNDPNARCDCGDPQPHPVDRFDVSAFVEEIDRLRAEVERYKAIERAAEYAALERSVRELRQDALYTETDEFPFGRWMVDPGWWEEMCQSADALAAPMPARGGTKEER